MYSNSFNFVACKWQEGKAIFEYKIVNNDEVFEFKEVLEFSDSTVDIPAQLLQNILDALHLVLGVSYYKLFCPKDIVLSNIQLSKEQAEFWNIVYTKGLGEFFYKNNIDFRGLIAFPYLDNEPKPVSFSRQNRSLVGIGGGKDSIVAGELLKKTKVPFSAFMVNMHPIMEQTVQLLGVDTVIVKRSIDPLLFELNKSPDTYNGHVPVSAQNAFIGLLSALLMNYKYVIMANEQSANNGNVEYLGVEVNHQWSKSYEFEKMFQQYVKTFITPDIFYFSLLRSFSELKITEIFANYPKYFSVFSSCNKNFRITTDTNRRWCGECPKCAFTFIMLSAFLKKSELVSIFGQNLFGKESLMQIYKELLGVSKIKPFECVGTPDEVKVAFYLALESKAYEEDIIMKFFKEEVLPGIDDIKNLREEVFRKSSEQSIPDVFSEVIEI